MHGPRSETPAACGAQEFYNHLREVDRENEVNRILGAFKLNPFEQLGVKFTVTPEDVRRAYRKVRPGRHERQGRLQGPWRRAATQMCRRRAGSRPPPRRCCAPQASLMVHPDKCKHARAKDAFEILGEAQKLLLDEERRENVLFLLAHARGESWAPPGGGAPAGAAGAPAVGLLGIRAGGGAARPPCPTTTSHTITLPPFPRRRGTRRVA